jgi:hypothetical protein
VVYLVRSLKQKANDRRLGRMAKRRFTSKRKTLKTKRSKTKTMARRKTTYRRKARSTIRRASKGRKGLGSFLKRGIVGDTTQALGAGMLIGTITDKVMPSVTPFATLGAEYLAGGLTGTIAAEGLKSITGQPSILSGVLGGFGFGTTSQPTETGV